MYRKQANFWKLAHEIDRSVGALHVSFPTSKFKDVLIYHVLVQEILDSLYCMVYTILGQFVASYYATEESALM